VPLRGAVVNRSLSVLPTLRERRSKSGNKNEPQPSWSGAFIRRLFLGWSVGERRVPRGGTLPPTRRNGAKGGIRSPPGVHVTPASAGPNSSASPPIPCLAGVSPRWARRRSAATIGVRVAATVARTGEQQGGSRGAQPEAAAVTNGGGETDCRSSHQHHTDSVALRQSAISQRSRRRADLCPTLGKVKKPSNE